MTSTYDCSDTKQRAEGLARAQRALAAKQCVVIPTDTVYGIAADAFSPQAVATLLAAKGRGRSMPPPVLIPRLQTMEGLASDVHPDARRLAEAFWPGGLTLIMRAQPSLTWDLGETYGTVALRMPDDAAALELLVLTGPLAVSSANRTGQAAATSATDAYGQLGESVEVYLDDGGRDGGAGASTIVDATRQPMTVVREGVISIERLREVVPGIGLPGQDAQDGSANKDSGDGDTEADAGDGDTEADASDGAADEDATVSSERPLPQERN
ncbi:L-threonylcarbamoyladenylate synthase [Arthrobacter sp. H5]|uniref:L-threonylcarbamoyladenylate synthase n=1 Tax=Arthrobacter sp. H5 TaxID=1267973 RepID=UPI000480CDD2|nr:L-threonylcarbamoyladenylate synthase [Arthrobacter sp. H5]